MGAPMATNLVKASFPVSVFNRTSSKCRELVQRGVAQCDSLAQLALDSDVVITVVADTPDVEEVLFGRDGLAPHLRPGSIVVDMSTISPSATMRFAQRLQEQRSEMLDAPVSGGESGAIAGTLSIMVGGKREVYEQCLPLLRAMGRTVVYTGLNGNGQKTKLVNQVVVALNLLATVEGLRLAAASGLDLQTTLEAVGGGAAASWMLSNLGPKIIAGDFRPGFAIRLQQKDLRLASELIKDLGLEAPGTELTYSLFTAAREKGLGEEGTQGLYQLWN